MNRNYTSIYNGISILFLVLAGLMIVFVVIQMTSATESDDASTVQLSTRVVLPSLTATNTPTNTVTATNSLTPTNTLTATNTAPPTATITPSATITVTQGPTSTPTITPTPAASNTPTATETSNVPTATFTATDSPFAFSLNGDVFIGPNGVNSAGCAWQGVGGAVIGLDGLEVTQQFQVRVFGNGIERTVLTASNSFYGANSGWEVVLGNAVTPGTYFVRLETTLGTPLSSNIEVTFPGDCSANSAVVRFQQDRALGQPPAAPTVAGP